MENYIIYIYIFIYIDIYIYIDIHIPDAHVTVGTVNPMKHPVVIGQSSDVYLATVG